MRDPRVQLRRATWVVRGTGAVALVVASAYAMRLPSTASIVPAQVSGTSVDRVVSGGIELLPLEPFQSVRLGPVIEEPPSAPPQLPEEEGLPLALVAIVRDGGALKAALYVPSEDRLAFVGRGELVGGFTIVAIDERGLELAVDGGGSRRIELLAAAQGNPP